MAQYTRTKSGSWTTRVYLGRDPNGKPIQKQITAPTKAELKKKEAKFLAENTDPKGTRSFRTAATEYIEKKRKATHSKDRPISPETISNYIKHLNRIKKLAPEFYTINIYDVTKKDREQLVEELLEHHSRSTVCSLSAFVSSVLKDNDVQSEYVVGTEDKDHYIPDDSTIERLIEDCTDDELEPAILLAAFGPMRRGEIAALTWDDIDLENCTVSVTKAQVSDEKGNYIIKGPKTRSSIRVIKYPQWVIWRISTHDKICDLTPGALTHRFRYFLKKHNYTPFRFHDLRHYAASYLHEQGIPDLTIQRRGGWKTDTVLKKVYIHELNKDSHDDQAIEALTKLTPQ